MYASLWGMWACRRRRVPWCASTYLSFPQGKTVLGGRSPLRHLLAHPDGESSDLGKKERAASFRRELFSSAHVKSWQNTGGPGAGGGGVLSQQGAISLRRTRSCSGFPLPPLHPHQPPLTPFGPQDQARHGRYLPLAPSVLALTWLCFLAGHRRSSAPVADSSHGARMHGVEAGACHQAVPPDRES